MATPLPIVELITQNVLKTLQSVATARGNAVTLWVERATRQGNTAQPGRISAFLKEHDPIPDEPVPQMHKQWNQPYSVLIQCFESDKSDFPARTTLQIAAAEVQRQLRQDCQRGGYAINTEITGITWGDDVASQGGKDLVLLIFQVKYRHLLNDPFSQ